MKQNQFIKMRRKVEKIVGDYHKTMAECAQNEKLHSETIDRISYPFLHGCFTLAVVGEMSSGKSTFINTLIGVDMLPTGHFQTTSAITYIEYGSSAQMKVLYADGKEKTFNGVNIKSTLRDLVALPEKYKDLPINDINTLIVGGDTWNQILSKKKGIEDKTQSPACEVDLWKKYVESHPQSVIAKEVRICYPLSEEMRGWRIVDTPGVGAIGGIQDATKKLFSSRDKDGNKLIDAIIFLQRGDDNIQSSANATFVQNVQSQLTEEAKERLFFVLTHATAKKFRLYRDEIMEKARLNYGAKYNIPENRLTYVDSLMARFHDDLVAQNIDVTDIDPDNAEPLAGWTEDECSVMYELFSPLKKELNNNRKRALNSENMLDLMEEWGNFTTLKHIINDFVKEVKETSFQKIVSLIRQDYCLMVEQYKKEIDLLKGGREAIENERTTLKQKKVEYNKVLNKLRRLAAVQPILEKFKFVDSELATLSQKKSIDEVRTSYQNMMDKALRVEKDTFVEIEGQFETHCKGFDAKDITLRKIDFAALTNKAHQASTTKESVYRTETYETGGWSSETKTRQVYVGTTDKTDYEKKRREFTAYVLKEARPIVESFKKQLQSKVKQLCDFVEEDINSNVAQLEESLTTLEASLTNKEDEEATRLSYIRIVEESKNKIGQYDNE